MTRKPYVAGTFYPSDRTELLEELQSCVPESLQKEAALGLLAPHAGYMYSGRIAGEVYARAAIPESVIILCPNHTGFPIEFSVWSSGEWLIPLGSVPVDESLARRVLEHCPGAEEDQMCHQGEHAIEVHLPFLKRARAGVRIVPVVVQAHAFERLHAFGKALGEVLGPLSRQVLVIASSDMTHFESQESASQKDRLAIDEMLALDEMGLWQTVQENHISMCGYGPAVIMLSAVKALGAKKAELIRYGTSGEVSGDYDRVVGYAGMIFN